MASINEQFSVVPWNNLFGLVSGSVSAIPFPTNICKLIRIKAHTDNDAPFYIGDDPTRMYWELNPNDDTGWVALDHVERLYYQNASGTTQYLTYWLQK